MTQMTRIFADNKSLWFWYLFDYQ